MHKDELLDPLEGYSSLKGQALWEFLEGPCSEDHLDDPVYKRMTDKKAIEICYARLATSPGQPTFRFPEDPLAMPLTCWHISSKAFHRINQFIQMKPQDDDLFFLMFAHGYEFDFGTKESSWEKYERICQTVSSQKDIICCSIGEAIRQHGKGE